MSTVYVAPTINTNDAARTAESVLERAPLDAVIAMLAAQNLVVAANQVAAAKITSTSLAAEQATQKAKGRP